MTCGPLLNLILADLNKRRVLMSGHSSDEETVASSASAKRRGGVHTAEKKTGMLVLCVCVCVCVCLCVCVHACVTCGS